MSESFQIIHRETYDVLLGIEPIKLNKNSPFFWNMLCKGEIA